MQLSELQCEFPVPATDGLETYHALLGGLELLLSLGQLGLVGLLIRLLGLDDGISLGSGLCSARSADLGGGGSSEFSHGELDRRRGDGGDN